MYVLGMNLLHDTSVALLKNGKPIAAVEEERFIRQKHTTNFPIQSLKWVLNYAGITLKDIEKIVLSFKIDDFKDNIYPFEQNTIMQDDLTKNGQIKIIRDNNLVYNNLLQKLNRYGISNWIGIPHHLAHAAGAYYSSGFKNANIIIIDGRGEKFSTSLLSGENGKIHSLKEYSIKDSLGHLYTYVTYLAGLYSSIGQEGKTMGLAPFGKPNIEMEQLFNNIIYYENLSYKINKKNLYKLKQFLQKEGKITKASASLAYYVQRLYNQVIIGLAQEAYTLTGYKNFALSGGVTLNCEGNRQLLSLPYVNKLFIQPAANDSGSSLGAALYWWNKYNKPNSNISFDNLVYLGPKYTNDEIIDLLKKYKLPYTFEKAPETLAANLLADGKIIGWFQGRLEYGPRALGNRSILANPLLPNVKKKINTLIKFREPWRPFAPSILREHIRDYFCVDGDFPYMTICLKCKKDKEHQIADALNIDGTARIQTVSKENNLMYYNLLTKFYEKTSLPILLNTSLNSHEPMVCTPRDAIRTFMTSGLDILIMNNIVLCKQK